MSTDQSSKANILWFLPTHGDGRCLGTTTGGREVNFNYLRQIAQAADQLGYFGVLLPTGRSCEDSWVVASAVAPWTERLRYLVAVRPGLQSPSVAARMTATLDRILDVPGSAADRNIGECDMEILRLALRRTRLVVPGVFTAVGMNGHDAARKQLCPCGRFLSRATLVTERFRGPK